MPMTPGYYMPNYYGSMYPGQTYPATNASPMQQSYAQQPAQGIQWVDGEVGAKAYQMPQGWPAGVPIALWDTNETVIYLKSMNPMGRPNPLQRIFYKMEELPQQQMLPAGQSGVVAQAVIPDMEGFAKKDDLEKMKQEILEGLKQNQSTNNQNGSQNGGGRR